MRSVSAKRAANHPIEGIHIEKIYMTARKPKTALHRVGGGHARGFTTPSQNCKNIPRKGPPPTATVLLVDPIGSKRKCKVISKWGHRVPPAGLPIKQVLGEY